MYSMLFLSSSSGVPIYAQIDSGEKRRFAAGALQPHHALPSVRGGRHPGHQSHHRRARLPESGNATASSPFQAAARMSRKTCDFSSREKLRRPSPGNRRRGRATSAERQGHSEARSGRARSRVWGCANERRSHSLSTTYENLWENHALVRELALNAPVRSTASSDATARGKTIQSKCCSV